MSELRKLCVLRKLAPPCDVLVDPGPVKTEGKTERELFERNAADQDTGEIGQVPDLLDITRRKAGQSEHEQRVERQKQQSSNESLPRQVRAAKHVGRSADRQRRDARVDRIPGQQIERHKEEEGSSEREAVK